MTAQPEVVWIAENENHPRSYITMEGPHRHATPYVPKASLTAALAERDKLEELYGSALSDALQKSTHVNNLMGDVETLTAERDEAKRELQIYLNQEQEICRLSDGATGLDSGHLKAAWGNFAIYKLDQQAILEAERDKLAKALGELVADLELRAQVGVYTGSDELDHDIQCGCGVLERARAVLTAQAAQGEKG